MSYYFPKLNKWEWKEYPHSHDGLQGWIELPSGKFTIDCSRNSDSEGYRVRIYAVTETETNNDYENEVIYELPNRYADRVEAKLAGMDALKTLLVKSIDVLDSV